MCVFVLVACLSVTLFSSCVCVTFLAIAFKRLSSQHKRDWCYKLLRIPDTHIIAAAALKTPTRNGYNAQGVNLTS